MYNVYTYKKDTYLGTWYLLSIRICEFLYDGWVSIDRENSQESFSYVMKVKKDVKCI